MEITNKIHIVKDFKEKSIIVSREFSAPLAHVWQAFTTSELLAKWWAPSPWKAETKVMDFRVGGYWLYAMVSPEGEKHWGKMNYVAIDHHKSYNLEDAFCDENGNINKDFPSSKGQVSFYPTENGTSVDFKMIYQTESDLNKVIEMGFEQGISMTLDFLDNLFVQKKI
jgi:uncharacterized protein YndB with AHSA1/START domain